MLILHLITKIKKILAIKKIRELTQNEKNDLSFLRSVLSQNLQDFKLNEFIKILKQQKLEQKELEEIEKILEDKITDSNILLSIYSCINLTVFENVLQEYLIQNPKILKPKTPVPPPTYNINFVKDYSFLK